MTTEISTSETILTCPECSVRLIYREGCLTCNNCPFSVTDMRNGCPGQKLGLHSDKDFIAAKQFELEHRPQTLVIDNSSATTHRLGTGSDRRGFTEWFANVMKHFRLKERTIAVGKTNENGTWSVRMGISENGHCRKRSSAIE